MILSCQNLNKAFHEKQVFKNCSFHIEDHEKAAIVGINGAGKTTLLRIIVGELEADSGQVVFGKDTSYGYLAQNAETDGENTIYDELLEVKKDVILLEEKIRSCELEMKHVEGDADVYKRQSYPPPQSLFFLLLFHSVHESQRQSHSIRPVSYTHLHPLRKFPGIPH